MNLKTKLNEDNVLSFIKDEINNNKIALFMKGNKSMPMCGFSAVVINILNKLDVEYQTYNVLDNNILRETIKQFSDWPTIPQLYINGEFIGGCDIIKDMYNAGDLEKIIKPT
ncbi:MAG TPA: Grx4 family monothiol glutaredoxin [Candidatus Megaira endosymbiont of Hartmannula sinica]|nr:Grx4 family monothiol glutaredoxin [Candidatus Megaera endosymbiont of Hartmannula sinica]